MFELDHVAVQSDDVPGTARWYAENFGAKILYQDATWAFLRVGQGKLAVVTPAQHPPHVAFRVDESTLRTAARCAGKAVDRHRDGTMGIYLDDPHGNVIELIYYPEGGTVYSPQAELLASSSDAEI